MRMLPALFLMLVFLPAVALADGMVVYHTEVGAADTIAVEAEAQRAVLWFRDGTWEMTIQPRFPRGAGAAAWLVPFPVVPEVSKASPDFLDALETLTSPVFIPYCCELESGGAFGCAATDSTGGGDGRAGSGEQLVTVWAQGTTDELEWVVIEAPGADALVAWLNEEGYRVPGILADKPEILEGQIVFAAKLKDGLDPGAPLPPMTFRLPGVDYEDVTYPLRLTAAVAPEEGMDLLLWVVTPTDSKWLDSPVPADVHWLPHNAGDTTREQWEADTETLRAAFPPEGGLVLEFNATFDSDELFLGHPLYPPDGWMEVMPQEVGIDLPEIWPAEVDAIGEGHYSVKRLRGRLTAAAMDEDLAFEFVPWTEVPSIKSIHWNEVPCSQIDAVSETTAAHSPLRAWVGVAMLALVTLLSMVFLRRIHP